MLGSLRRSLPYLAATSGALTVVNTFNVSECKASRDCRNFTQFDARVLDEINSGRDKFYGRIICVNPHKNPLEKSQPTLEFLCDEDQKLPFIMGPEGVQKLHGMNHRDLLLNIG